MHAPGELLFNAATEIAADIKYYERVNRDLAGKQAAAGGGLDSVLVPPADNTHGWLSEVALGQELGHGAFGSVFKGKQKGKDSAYVTKDGKEIAIKIIRCLDYSDDDAKALKIYMEFVAGGSLAGLIKAGASFMTKLHVVKEVGEGLLYLHTFQKGKAILHLDIKPDNILLSQPEKGYPFIPKLVDFGMSELISNSHNSHKTAIGMTPAYASPEVLRMETPTIKSDVYSFGVLLWYVFTEKVPFSGIGQVQMRKEVTAGVRPDLKDIPEEAAALVELICSCWQNSQEGRPSMQEVVSWLQEACGVEPAPIN
ncbi:hypothetical protein MMC07_006822 [Pseudocyphellaria aurata]|nr:hypothetical protein [Pseudocyphellaria aurata]